MSVKLTWHGKEFAVALRAATADGLRRVAVAYHADCQRAVNKSNRRGTEPSLPGEAPRKRTGFGQQGIVWEYNGDTQRPAVRVGVTKNALYMFWLEVGTKPRVITAKGGKLLMIPWRGKSPSKQERQKIGLKKVNGKWVYFRRSVKIPGIKPRPWLVATFMANQQKYARLATLGMKR